MYTFSIINKASVHKLCLIVVLVSIMHWDKLVKQSSSMPLLLAFSLMVCQQCDHWRGTPKSVTYLGGKMDDVMSPHAAQSMKANGLIRQTTNTHYYYFYYCLSKLLKCCGCDGSICIMCQPTADICVFSYWTCVQFICMLLEHQSPVLCEVFVR